MQHPFAVSTHWSIKNTRNKNSAEMPATVKKARKVRTFVVELADEAEALATDPEAAMPPRCEAPDGAGLYIRHSIPATDNMTTSSLTPTCVRGTGRNRARRPQRSR